MSATITYAKVFGPPDNWIDCRVYDENGAKVTEVIEVNAEEGWLIRYATDASGCLVTDGDEARIERIEGIFRIEVAK